MTDAFYEWYNVLPPTLQVYWVIALITSLVFIIQMVLTFIGIGDADSDVDFGGDADLGGDADFSDGDTLVRSNIVQMLANGSISIANGKPITIEIERSYEGFAALTLNYK